MPTVDFVAEATNCPSCGAALKIQKSKSRIVMTVAHGAFEALEIRKKCTGGDGCPPVASRALRQLVRPGQRYGYDLIVYVGTSRYLQGKQRQEICDALYEEGIELSTGTVSAICDRFLSLLESLHLHRIPELRDSLRSGYPLHIDATCERGKGGLFVCLDGFRNWVLWAGRIPSENSDHLKPLVDRTVELFGDPIAVVRDMGDAGGRAVEELRQRGVPDLICHYHFLAAVGDKLFNTLYNHLKGMIRVSRVRTDLRTLLRDLQPYETSEPIEGRFGSGCLRESLKALILWMLEADGTKDVPFPFALPHLDFARRCRRALERAETWIPRPRTQPERRALRRLRSLVSRLFHDQRMDPTMGTLEDRWRAFSELRDVLRLSEAELPRGDTRYRQRQLPALELLRLEQIKEALDKYQEKLVDQIPPDERDKTRSSSTPAVILKYLERNRSRLFGHPARLDKDGKVIAVVERTNNVIERFFGQDKRQLRRRLGRAHLGRDLEQQPAQVALVSNLRSPAYVRVLCGSLDDLPESFASLEAHSLVKPSRLDRENRDSKLLRHVRQLLENRETPSATQPDKLAQRSKPTLQPISDADIAPKEQKLRTLSDEQLRTHVAQIFAPTKKTPPQARKPQLQARDLRLPPPGSQLERWYNGRVYRVSILEDGFEFRGIHWSSLTRIATSITGITYSGLKFFGLTVPWEQLAAQMKGRRINRTTLIDLASATES